MRARPSPDGGRVLFFKKTEKEYYQEPYTGMEIPCGVCLECRQEQARQWAVRITHEAQQHDANAFITLTYDDNHLPEDGGLRYEDLTKFWKRLRKALHGRTISYYAVGEYGEKTQRPHYHACVFGENFAQDRIVIRESPNMLWTSLELQRTWGLGNVSVGALTYQTAAYTASYVTKKLKTKQTYVTVDESSGELVALEQPRPFMSRNIAKPWWEVWRQGVIDHDRVVIQARPQKPPKAYDKWLGEVDEEKLREIKEQRQINVQRLTQPQKNARARNAHARHERERRTL